MTDPVKIHITVQDGEGVEHFAVAEATFDEAVAALILKLWPDVATHPERRASVLPSIGAPT